EGGEVLGGLGHPRVVRGDDEEHGGHGPQARQRRADEALVARDVDEGDLPGARQGGPRVAELDGQAAPLLLLQPVRLRTGERRDEGRLAVVDVPRRRDDVHHPAPAAATARTAATRSSSCSGGTARRSRSRRPRCARPRTGTAPVRSACAHAASTATAALASSTPGAPPPPTAATLGTASAATSGPSAAAIRRARSRRVAGSVPSPAGTGGTGPARVASSAARVSLSTRSARAKGWRRSPSTTSASPSSSPHWGPPSSLSPEAVTSVAPARSVAE